MGCGSSSVQVSMAAEPKSNQAEKASLQQVNDNTSDYSSCGNLTSVVDEDARRLSVLTVRSGNLKFNEYSNDDSPMIAVRSLSTVKPANLTDTPPMKQAIKNSMFVNKIAGKRDEKFPEFRPKRTRPGHRINLVPLTSQRYASLSLPNSPLVRVKERPEAEFSGKSSMVDLRSDKNLSQEETQVLLNRALKELSKSLSDSHGSIFHIGAEDDNNITRTASSSPTLSPHLHRISVNSTEQLCLQGKAVVMDIGSGFCKAGLSYDDVPSVVFPTLLGRASDASAIPGVSKDAIFVGNDVMLRRGALTLSRPVQRGVVIDWDDWRNTVDHILNMELKLDKDDISAVFPESPLSTRAAREKTTEIMFENISAARLYQGSSAPMTLHAFNMTSGLMVSVGHDVTSCVPVIQGNVKKGSVRALELGGADITKKLKDFLHEGGKEVKNGKGDSIAKAMMERLCYVTYNGSHEDDNTITRKQRTYSLPTGTAVNLDKEKFLAPEILFRPETYDGNSSSQTGLHKLCVESVNACKNDDNDEVTQDLYKNVVLVGGASLLPGLSQRLKEELVALLPHLTESDIKVHAYPKRQYATWRGAALMTSLHSSRGRWMTKADYDEYGPTIVHRKFF
ncbi:unnamed protein product [Clavelina lepadiformis]|uniref:Actin n=1 Tax=Clavelina lepadiformis TaxID=159417 RepID=A0ABP0GZF7_CLALP